MKTLMITIIGMVMIASFSPVDAFDLTYYDVHHYFVNSEVDDQDSSYCLSEDLECTLVDENGGTFARGKKLREGHTIAVKDGCGYVRIRTEEVTKQEILAQDFETRKTDLILEVKVENPPWKK